MTLGLALVLAREFLLGVEDSEDELPEFAEQLNLYQEQLEEIKSKAGELLTQLDSIA